MKKISEKEKSQENEFNAILKKLKPSFGYPANTEFIKSLQNEMKELLKELNNVDITEEINTMDVSIKNTSMYIYVDIILLIST